MDVKMRHVLYCLAACATALVVASCNGSNNPFVGPTPGPTCSPPNGTQYALVYPAPNATAIPDQFGQIIIGASPALPSSWQAVTSTVLANTAGGTFQPFTGTLPSPSTTPSFANPTYQSSSFGNLTFPGEVVNVYLNNSASTCTPVGPIGSFTTQ